MRGPGLNDSPGVVSITGSRVDSIPRPIFSQTLPLGATRSFLYDDCETPV